MFYTHLLSLVVVAKVDMLNGLGKRFHLRRLEDTTPRRLMSSNEAVAGSGTAVKVTLTVSERNVACPSGSFTTQAPSENVLMSTGTVPLPVHELVLGNTYGLSLIHI